MIIETDKFKVHLTTLKTVKKIEAYDTETDEWVDVSDVLWAIKLAERLLMKESQ